MRFLALTTILTLLGIAAAPSAIAQQDATPEVGAKGVDPFILEKVEVFRSDVFDSTAAIPLVTPVLDYIHILTKESVVLEEVFIAPGDTITQHVIDEIERNLRSLTIFSWLDFKVVPVPGERDGLRRGILQIYTRDNWSTRLGATYNHDGDDVNVGASVREVNLFGLAQQLGFGADYSTLYDRGWRFTTSYADPNLFGTHFKLGAAAAFSKYERSTALSFGRPFYTDQLPHAFNAAVGYFEGDDFFFFRNRPVGSPLTIHAYRTDASAWYASSRGERDVFRTSLSITYNKTSRDSLPGLRTAFENSVGVFGGISSLGRTFTRITNADFHGTSEVPIGGSGSVTIGKISPIAGGLDNVAYIGADARKAVATDNLYGFAGIQAGTGVAGKEARFTMQHAFASGGINLEPGWLVARIDQSTVWRWPRYLFQPLDNGTGLRGYTKHALFGDNKFVANLEYRLIPIFSLLMFQFGAVGFYDIGSVWNQGEQLSDLRFHSSAGIGIRVANRRGSIDKGLLRVDLAYNFDERRVAQLIISSQESFDLFGTLDYRPPAPYVP